MEKAISSEANLKLEMVEGKLKLSVNYDGKQADAQLAVMLDSDLFVDKIMEIIPGDSAFELTMGALLKTALKSVKV